MNVVTMNVVIMNVVVVIAGGPHRQLLPPYLPQGARQLALPFPSPSAPAANAPTTYARAAHVADGGINSGELLSRVAVVTGALG